MENVQINTTKHQAFNRILVARRNSLSGIPSPEYLYALRAHIDNWREEIKQSLISLRLCSVANCGNPIVPPAEICGECTKKISAAKDSFWANQ